MNRRLFNIEEEDLATRSRNIIKNLGGIKELLVFYKEQKSFLGIPKSGRYTNEELCSFCESLLKKEEDPPIISITKDQSEIEIGKRIALYETQKKSFSRRVQNILEKLEVDRNYDANVLNKEKYITDLFLTDFDFSKLTNVGYKSKLEFQDFKNVILNGDFESKEPIALDIEKCIHIYEAARELLSKRSKNVIDRLEIDNGYYSDLESKEKYIRDIFYNDFEFSKLANIGTKSITELQSLKDTIVSGNLNKEIKAEQIVNEKASQSLNKFFSIEINDEEIDELFINGEYSFKQILCVVLLSTKKINEKTRIVIGHKYFSRLPYDRKAVSKELSCSIERIRQIEPLAINLAIPWAVNSVFAFFGGKPYDLPIISGKNILALDTFPHFIFKDRAYEPNTEFSKVVYSSILKDDYEPIDKFVPRASKSFEASGINLFVLKSFAEESELFKLLNWLDEQIYYFETISFEYKMEVLIKRYYSEQDKGLSSEALQDLHFIIKSAIREKTQFELNANKRLVKRNFVDSIINEVYLFLKGRNEAQVTNVILEHLNRQNIAIEKLDLLRYLNHNKKTFSSLGSGNWVLKEWNKMETSGSFREIVRNLLLKRAEPIHISALYEYINTMKRVSLKSMSSNLKSETEGTFKFFNCSYIGLSEKKYADFWYRIPQFRAYHLNNKILQGDHIDDRYIVQYLKSKFGYPEQHLSFILDCKRGKYG